MCIAIAKLKGQDMPTEKILRNCFFNNPDGGGFAFNLDGRVIIKKGFMKVDEFINAINHYDQKYNFKNRGVLIHTRITTHGGTCPEMCHPFPICSDEWALKKTEYNSPYAVIHNGVIALTSLEATQKKVMSDTAVFVSKYLTKIASNQGWFKNKANIEMVDDLIDSKMAILNGRGDIIMTTGFTEDNGVWYSNSTYKDFGYSRFYSARNYTYDDYYDGYDDYYRTYGKSGYEGSSACNDDYIIENHELTKKNTNLTIVKEIEGKTEVEEKKENNSHKPIMSLMRVKEGYYLCMEDGSIEDPDDSYELYISEEAEAYYCLIDSTNEPTNSMWIQNKCEYLGKGKIYRIGSIRPEDFHVSHYISSNYLV